MQERVIDQSVLHIDKDTYRSIDAREFFHGQNCLKERAAGAAEFFRRFNSHQAHLEALFYQRRIETPLLFHLFDAFANLAFGKLAHTVAKHLFVFR